MKISMLFVTKWLILMILSLMTDIECTATFHLEAFKIIKMYFPPNPSSHRGSRLRTMSRKMNGCVEWNCLSTSFHSNFEGEDCVVMNIDHMEIHKTQAASDEPVFQCPDSPWGWGFGCTWWRRQSSLPFFLPSFSSLIKVFLPFGSKYFLFYALITRKWYSMP